MSGIDGDQLIALVFERQAIWDKRAKQHSNRNYVEKCWKEISIEMKIDGKYCNETVHFDCDDVVNFCILTVNLSFKLSI
jgi:hypothetical protein